MSNKKITKDIILYLMKDLGIRIEGKKKIMKLMFLIEHFDFKLNEIVERQNLGNQFFIYYYGVFSTEIMESVTELTKEGKVQDGFPLHIKTKQKIDTLKPEIQTIVDKVITRFGKYSGYKLEIGTLKMLGIKPSEKKQYSGESIQNILNP